MNVVSVVTMVALPLISVSWYILQEVVQSKAHIAQSNKIVPTK